MPTTELAHRDLRTELVDIVLPKRHLLHTNIIIQESCIRSQGVFPFQTKVALELGGWLCIKLIWLEDAGFESNSTTIHTLVVRGEKANAHVSAKAVTNILP